MEAGETEGEKVGEAWVPLELVKREIVKVGAGQFDSQQYF